MSPRMLYMSLFLGALVASLAAAAPGPVEVGTSLSVATFTSTISKGMWFVEFFSPYCPHCKHFMPTWKTLVEMHEHLADSSDFHFGQVDCISQMDLCTSEKIPGYPSLILFEDGKRSDEYKDDRAYDMLSTFILEHAASYKKSKAALEPVDNAPVAMAS